MARDSTPRHDNDNNNNKHDLSKIFPASVITILLTETAERFAYYGFRAILILYFTEQLNLDETTSIAFFAYTTSLAYVMPLFGALLADAYFGKYKTIVAFGCTYAIGIGILTIAAYNVVTVDDEDVNLQVVLTFFGLVLICIGTGGIKPCVSPFGADQLLYSESHNTSSSDQSNMDIHSSSADSDSYDFQYLASSSSTSFDCVSVPTRISEHLSKEEVLNKFFSWFYFGINVGSLASFLIIPSIRAKFGFGAAFLLPTILIVIAMLLFVSKKGDYVIFTPSAPNSHHQGASLVNVFRIYKSMLSDKIFRRKQTISHSHTIQYSSTSTSVEERSKDGICGSRTGISLRDQEDARAVLKVFPVFAAFPTFWMLFDQQGSVWILQANNMNLHGIQPEQLGVLNPLFIMFLIPVFDQYVYPFCQSKGWSTSHLRRISWGMFLAALSFFASGFLDNAINREYEKARNMYGVDDIESDVHKINIFWQIPQIFILSIAEILVSITGLEFAYNNSPPPMKALIMAAFQLTSAFGNMFGGILYSVLSSLERGVILHICGVLMLLNLLIFKRIECWWNKTQTRKHRAYDEPDEEDIVFEEESHIIS